jgi:gluconokinase
MGVSGSGKSTVAAALAARFGFVFADGDSFHPESNVAKLARGEPLTDADREPWLRALAAWIQSQHDAGRSSVLACSALKRGYRDTLRAAALQHVQFVYLAVPAEILHARLRHRKGHFVGPSLLESQLATLEPLELDEPGVTVDGSATPATIVDRIARLKA